MVLMLAVRVPPSMRQWLWFAALYLAAVGIVAVVAYGLRALLKLLV
jgi:hypothetical protein